MYLIRTYGNGTVLDFAMGSGSTGVAAKLCGQNFIGIERDEKMLAVATTRILECEREREHALKVYASHFEEAV